MTIPSETLKFVLGSLAPSDFLGMLPPRLHHPRHDHEERPEEYDDSAEQRAFPPSKMSLSNERTCHAFASASEPFRTRQPRGERLTRDGCPDKCTDAQECEGQTQSDSNLLHVAREACLYRW